MGWAAAAAACELPASSGQRKSSRAGLRPCSCFLTSCRTQSLPFTRPYCAPPPDYARLWWVQQMQLEVAKTAKRHLKVLSSTVGAGFQFWTRCAAAE